MFCLQDGAPLIQLVNENSSQSYRTEETLVMGENAANDPRKEPTEIMETAVTQEQRIRPVTARSESYTTAPKQNTALIVVLSVLVTLILVVLAAGGLWLLLKDRKNDDSNRADLNKNENKSNTNNNQNKNSNNSNNTNNSNTAPTPAPKPIDTAEIREAVTQVLNGWSSAARAHDLETQIRYYADTVSPYYNASSYSVSKIKSERERVFALYDTIDVDLTNIKITPDPSGEKATAVFDKTWVFQGDTKRNSGSVQQKIWLAKISGRWRITGEKDLKVYYVNKE